jgi:tellurite methyltransferase
MVKKACMLMIKDIVIDIRAEAEFVQGHQQGSVHFDGVAALSERQYELPEPQQVMTIVHSSEQVADLLAWIQNKGYQHTQWQLWSEAFKDHLIQQQALSTGMSDGYAWRPSNVVEYFTTNVALPDDVPLRYGLDIGSGAGRDLVYLAMQGWQMTGVDLRLEMLEKAQALALRQQVSITTWQRDCEQLIDPFADLADASLGLINVARYLHRPLFPIIKRLLAPEGYILYHTFMQGCEAFGSPKNPRFLIAPNELATIFIDYQILLDEVITLADGRPMAAFIAKKN